MVDRNDYTHASTSGFQDRVSQKAYDLWLAEGRPQGCAERHWHQAEQAVALETLERQHERQREDQREHEYEQQCEELPVGVGVDGQEQEEEPALRLDTAVKSRQGKPAPAWARRI